MLNKIKDTVQSEKALVLIDQAIYSGTSFVVTAILARFLGIEKFGTFSYLVLGLYLLMSMSNALIIQPMQVAYSKLNVNARYRSFTFSLQVIVSILLLGLSGLLDSAVFQHTELLKGVNALQIGALYSIWLFQDFFRKTFLASQEIKNTVAIDSIIAVVQLGSLLALGFGNMLTLNTAVLAITISYLLSSLVGFTLSNISLGTINFDKQYLGYHKKEGSLLFLSSLLQWWSSNLFVVASGIFLGAAALGGFRLVQSMFGVLNLLLQTYENYVLPKASRVFSESKSNAKKYLQIITQKGAILFALILVPLFVFSKQAILLFGGQDYETYHFIVRGMVILYAIIFAGYSVRMPIRILTLNSSFLIGYAISLAFSLLTFNYLLQEFNVTGAIVGLITNQVLMITYWHTKLRQYNFSLWT